MAPATGVGLELHEPGPRTLTTVPSILQPGMVTSVEPGVYYTSNINGGIGGCRIEDVVAITEKGYTNLTNAFQKRLDHQINPFSNAPQSCGYLKGGSSTSQARAST